MLGQFRVLADTFEPGWRPPVRTYGEASPAVALGLLLPGALLQQRDEARAKVVRVVVRVGEHHFVLREGEVNQV